MVGYNLKNGKKVKEGIYFDESLRRFVRVNKIENYLRTLIKITNHLPYRSCPFLKFESIRKRKNL